MAVVVGPAGDGGHGDGGAEQLRDEGLGGGSQVRGCDCGDGGVSDYAPGVGAGG